MADIAETIREGLLAMSVGVGFRVLAEMMEEELTAKIGLDPRTARAPLDLATPIVQLEF